MVVFSWLHLSDIHFGHGTTKYEIDQELVLKRLAEDAVQQVASEAVPRPDWIIVTGDIANTGAGRDNTEYDRALDWLCGLAERLGVPADRVLFTPGNHDANRGVELGERFPKRLLDALRYGGRPVDEAIADGQEAAILADRFANYRDFVERLGGPAANADRVTQFWDRDIPLGDDLTLRIVSFNSAMLAAEDDDESLLQFGQSQIQPAFGADIDSGRITMMLTHHPFSWLRDGPAVDQYARTDGGIHLSGHLHVPEAEQSTRAGENTLVRIAAGAVHGDETGDQQHAYNFGCLSIDDGWATVTVYPRVFNGAAFVRHGELCDDDANSSTFPPLNKKRLVPPPTPSVGADSIRRRRSMALLEDVAERRTAYPTDMSIGQLAERELLIEPRLTGRDDRKQLDIAVITEELVAGHTVLVLGDPGAGKTVLTFLAHSRLLQETGAPEPLPLSVVDLVGRDHLDLAAISDVVGVPVDELDGGALPIFIVDGIDEAIAGGFPARDIGAVLGRLAEFGTLLVTCRIREFEVDLMAQLNLGVFRRIVELQPWDMEEFTTYLQRLAAAEILADPEATLAWIRRDDALVELTKRPLLARMLTFVAQQGDAPTPTNASELYEAYLRQLARWVEQRLGRVGCEPRAVYSAWRNFAWHVFQDRRLAADTMAADVPAKFFSDRMSLECAYEVGSGILDYIGARGELRARFRHYTFYEFLVADHIADALDVEAQRGSGSCAELFELDLSREVRRHLTRLIDSQSQPLADLLVTQFASLTEIANQTRRRLVGNLLAYYIGRVNVDVERVKQLLVNEEDLFLRNSLRWTLANLDNIDAITSFIDEMEDETHLTGSWNRGYLRYYYGDLDRELAVPPYTDDDASATWSRTRAKTLEMLSRADYGDSEPGARRALDVFTHLDFCRFHGDRLTDNERRAVLSVIETLGGEAPHLAERLARAAEELSAS